MMSVMTSTVEVESAIDHLLKALSKLDFFLFQVRIN